MKDNLAVISLIILLIATFLPKYSIFGFEIYNILSLVVALILMFDGNKKRRAGNNFGMMNMFLSIGLILMVIERI